MKEGIEYFPLDVCLDDKFELIEAEFGLTGFAVVVKLLQKIYGQFGYYCEWNIEVALLFAKRIGLGGSVVSEIVAASIRRGIFDKTMYDRYGILTSVGIQKRYFEAVSRRKIVKIKKEYLLVPCAQIPKNVYISEENVYISSENVDISKQSKVEESKVNNTNTYTVPAAPALSDVIAYCNSRGLNVNPKRFFAYYSKLGWKTKEGKPVDDWYSLCEKWSETEHAGKAKETPQGSSFDTDDFFAAALAASRRDSDADKR